MTKEIIELLGIEDAKIYHGYSFLIDATIYKTKHEDVYISEYDVVFGHLENKPIASLNLLKSKGIYILFLKKKGLFIHKPISAMLFEDNQYLNLINKEINELIDTHRNAVERGKFVTKN